MLPARQLPMRPTALSTARRPDPSPCPRPCARDRWGDLAAPLDQGAVGIEEKLCVVEGSTVAFVDADGHTTPASCRRRRWRWWQETARHA
jgi:hypothetical protein